MLRKYSQVFLSILFITDMAVVTAAWLLAYEVRFHAGWFEHLAPLYEKTPRFSAYLAILPLILAVWAVLMRREGLYLPRRVKSPSAELVRITRVSTVSVFVVVALTFFYRPFEIFTYSRVVMGLFWLFSCVALTTFRIGMRQIFRELRRRGYNLRHILIVGAGDLAREVIRRVKAHPEVGLSVGGLLAGDMSKVGKTIDGIPVLGVYEDVQRVLQGRGIDQVVIALPADAHDRLDSVLKFMGEEMVDVRVVPDLYHHMKLRAGVEDFDGLPMVRIQDSPMAGWNRVVKRLFDIAVSGAMLLVAAPFMLLVAGMIKLLTPGPVFFRQTRMGFDGRCFDMIKFRTMRVNAEAGTGAVWAKEDDPRRTPLGRVLRKLSLDELPQLLNVLRGDMSMVGPRPERPELIEQFKKQIPKYMLRHKVKAGLTGLAQVRGLRGNTSLEKRIDSDLYYIEHWSLSADIEILLRTVPAVLLGKGAH
ncbi:MAG: undecaprenyl-phosphate glucose phosphotransferase [Deltaproteobacteria bacterium]|nr:undecaprenyl-phosphate glucose phosphotransferase [Deltaproteobacteria bacterium]